MEKTNGESFDGDDEYVSQMPEEAQEVRDNLQSHAKGCRSVFRTIGVIVKKILMVVGIFVFGALGIGMSWWSFSEIEQMRQLERTPEMPAAAVVGGEVNVTGTAQRMDRTVTSPDTGTSTLYYRYTVEERRGSGDNRRWETIQSQSDGVEFLLEDDSGSVIVDATSSTPTIEAPRQYRDQSDGRRYTEYRIDPGEELFVFGYAELDDGEARVGFGRDGSYTPIISHRPEIEQRTEQTLESGAFVVFGVMALLVSVFLVFRVFRIHHAGMYVTVVTAVVVGTLFVQGFMMMVDDLRAADEAASRTLDEGRSLIVDTLRENDVDVDGSFNDLGSFDDEQYAVLNDEERERLSGARVTMARSVERTNETLTSFPELFVGLPMGIRPLEALDVPPEEQEQISALEEDYEPVRLEMHFGLIAIAIGLFGIVLFTWRGLKSIGTKRTIENVPTSPIEGAVYGLTELKASVSSAGQEGYLNGPLTNRDCVFYRYKVEKRTRSGRKKKKKWKTIKDEKKAVPFVCEDGTGEMYVDPEGAECIGTNRKRRRRGSKRYTEWIIGPGDDVYALGETTVNPETHDDLMMCQDDEKAPFIVAGITEEKLKHRKAFAGFMLLSVGIVATMIGGMGVAGMEMAFGPTMYVTMAGISCGYLFGVLVIMYYNDLVFLRDRVRRAESNIDVALKKRFDLIENLAGIVQEYLGHEQQLQQSVAQARKAREQSEEDSVEEAEIVAENEARNRLFALLESNPDLKGQKVIQEMMQTLTEVENDIVLMREGYNDSVERYNNRLDHIPEIFVARLLWFRHAEHLTVGPGEREVVSVS